MIVNITIIIELKDILLNIQLIQQLAQGMSKYIGSVEVGKIADLVLWEPPYFGVKPHLIIKGGMAMRGNNWGC